MIKTHSKSRFSLLTLAQIRDAREVILQAEDTHTNFQDGQKCYLCEIVSRYEYDSTKTEKDLIKEICVLNAEKRRLEKQNMKLQKLLDKRSNT